MKLAGKVAVVVGGARGMGYACVEAILEKSAKVCFGDILESLGDAVCEQWQQKYGRDCVHFRKCDVCAPREIEALFTLAEQNLGRVEIFLNMAGFIHEFDWDKCLDVNVRGSIHCMTSALAHMGKDKGGNGGTVTLMSSSGGLGPAAWGPVYCGTKHFIVGYCRTWAEPLNYEQHGIRINCLCPTAVDTQFVESAIIEAKDKVYHPEVFAEGAKGILNKSDPKMVGDAFLHILEDDSVNGKAVRITQKYGIDYADLLPIPEQ